MSKTKTQLEEELRVLECLQAERNISNNMYAMKLVERIVYGLVALILVAVMSAIIGLVVWR